MSDFKYVETKRNSKAQKRRDTKAAKKAEQLKRIEDGEKEDEHKDRRIEQEKLANILKRLNLRVHDIEADGDCLYKAVEHQLMIASDSNELLSCQQIRERTSQYMQDNPDNFTPFLLKDNGDLMNPKEFSDYCSKIAKTKEWGGHLELTAISQITQKPIHIFQAENKRPIEIIPSQTTDKTPILLSFHKHLYHLGEHYNSLVEVTSD